MTSISHFFPTEYTMSRAKGCAAVLFAVTKPPCTIPRYVKVGDVNFKVFFGDVIKFKKQYILAHNPQDIKKFDFQQLQKPHIEIDICFETKFEN